MLAVAERGITGCRYGTDKPDLRFGFELSDISAAVSGCSFKVFSNALEAGGIVKAIRVPSGGRISNSRIKPKGDIANEAVAAGAAGLAHARVTGGVLEAAKAIKEGLSLEQAAALITACGAEEGDLILFAAGSADVVNRALDRVRRYIGAELGGDGAGPHSLHWVVDWPMFEFNADENRYEALHHPFTAPQGVVGGGADLAKATAHAYDLVYNGVEIGGGSLRIYRRDVQEAVFATIGLSDAEARAKFGYLLDAFEFGAPPHGGLAFGVDRLAMLMTGAASIRFVTAMIHLPRSTTT